ncbi:glycosyltransferase [Streptomyces sp. NPDC016309]|uniref:glycosyltransferase n=1 Tax=Streptomyces sp. NPDC016309 TaxID=3364965 RepID=UPI0036FB2C89
MMPARFIPFHDTLAPEAAMPQVFEPESMPAILRRPPVDLEVIIPAYNEERRISDTIAATVSYLGDKNWSSAVVVVDNDSADGTLDVTSRFGGTHVPVHVIGCSDHGKGAAVRRGIMTSSAHFLGFVDADNATPVETLDRIMPLLVDGRAAAVIASRRATGAIYEIEQSLGRRFGTWLFHHLAPPEVRSIADTQCGFKFFNGPLIREIAQTCHVDGFAFDVELLCRLAQRHLPVVELPVAWSDMPGSTFSARRDGLRSMADLLRLSYSG